jgi:hypothetical protein
LVFLLSALVGLPLLLLKAPIWAFYVAPVCIVPLMIHELLHLERNGSVGSGRKERR